MRGRGHRWAGRGARGALNLSAVARLARYGFGRSAWTLTGVRVWPEPAEAGLRELHVARGRVVADPAHRSARLHVQGAWLLPGLINAHDHLGLSSYPPTGRPPHANVYDWAAAVERVRHDPALVAAAAVPLHDRLLLGGLRNLLAGVSAVVQHDPIHPLLVSAWRFRANVWRHHGFVARVGFPVRVATGVHAAHSLGYEPSLDARALPAQGLFAVHAAEGRDARTASEIGLLGERGLLGPRTVLVHALAAGEADIARLAASDTAVVWCPESNQHLYGATAAVARLHAARVRLALGSDSSLSGVRDALSNLASAKASGVFDDDALLDLATRRGAALFGLPVGGAGAGAVADFVLVDERTRLLAGDRRAIQLVVVDGRALYGRPDWLAALHVPAVTLDVDGAARALHADLARLLRAILVAHPAARQAPWLVGVH